MLTTRPPKPSFKTVKFKKYKTPSENETDAVCVIFRTAYKLRTRELTHKSVAADMKITQYSVLKQWK